MVLATGFHLSRGEFSHAVVTTILFALAVFVVFGRGSKTHRVFEKSSGGNRSSSRDANYHQYRQALRYRSDRCGLDADSADVAGSSTRRPTAHNQHSRCVERNLLSTTNRLPMAF